jgi:hypothetical protein
MLRELSRTLDDLHDGLVQIELREGVAISGVEMTLPLEFRAVLRDGGCVLLAVVPRAREGHDWLPSASRLHVGWGAPP